MRHHPTIIAGSLGTLAGVSDFEPLKDRKGEVTSYPAPDALEPRIVRDDSPIDATIEEIFFLCPQKHNMVQNHLSGFGKTSEFHRRSEKALVERPV